MCRGSLRTIVTLCGLADHGYKTVLLSVLTDKGQGMGKFRNPWKTFVLAEENVKNMFNDYLVWTMYQADPMFLKNIILFKLLSS